MVSKVRPLSWLLRFFTFSRRKALGLWCSRILAISKNKVPWILQSKPWDLPSEFFLLTPARLNGWHGNPARRTSWLGIDFVSTSLISPASSWSISKLALYVCCANLSISLVKTQFPPIDSKPFLKPPMPAKRSIKSNCFCKIFNLLTWDSWIFLLLNSYLIWHRDL